MLYLYIHLIFISISTGYLGYLQDIYRISTGYLQDIYRISRISRIFI
jgi:hypothetical protein